MIEWISHILLYPIGRQEFSLDAQVLLGLKMCLHQWIGSIIVLCSLPFVMKPQPEFWQQGYARPPVRSHLPVQLY